MNFILRTAFFLSAFAPALVVSVAANTYTYGFQDQLLPILAVGALGCVLPFLILVALGQRGAELAFQAKKVESQDWMLVAFVVSYFIPLVANLKDYSTFVLIMIAAALLLATIEALPCHPLLHLFRYRFYKVEATNGIVYTVITRRRILSAADLKAVREISATMLLEV